MKVRVLRDQFWHMTYRVSWLRSASCVGENALMSILSYNLYGLVALECVSSGESAPRYILAYKFYNFMAPECVSCKKGDKKVVLEGCEPEKIGMAPLRRDDTHKSITLAGMEWTGLDWTWSGVEWSGLE